MYDGSHLSLTSSDLFKSSAKHNEVPGDGQCRRLPTLFGFQSRLYSACQRPSQVPLCPTFVVPFASGPTINYFCRLPGISIISTPSSALRWLAPCHLFRYLLSPLLFSLASNVRSSSTFQRQERLVLLLCSPSRTESKPRSLPEMFWERLLLHGLALSWCFGSQMMDLISIGLLLDKRSWGTNL